MNLKMRVIALGASFICLSLVSGCGWRAIPQAKNDVEAQASEVTNQYKRRADLIPNLVNVVKGYAKHESTTLEDVIAARAKATQVTIDPTQMTAEKLQEFQKAQGSLSSALGRLMVVIERYPDLKADRNFRELQAQLEGVENRITIARQRHIEAIKNHNNLITVPPESWTNSLFYHFEKLPQWSVENAKSLEEAPKVEM